MEWKPLHLNDHLKNEVLSTDSRWSETHWSTPQNAWVVGESMGASEESSHPWTARLSWNIYCFPHTPSRISKKPISPQLAAERERNERGTREQLPHGLSDCQINWQSFPCSWTGQRTKPPLLCVQCLLPSALIHRDQDRDQLAAWLTANTGRLTLQLWTVFTGDGQN